MLGNELALVNSQNFEATHSLRSKNPEQRKKEENKDSNEELENVKPSKYIYARKWKRCRKPSMT